MAKQQRTEEELNIKRKARRRLVGAIALALAVVVILPMVLDSEPKTTGQDIDLRIPAADKAGEFMPGVAISEVIEAESQAASAVSPVASEVAVPAESLPVAQPVASGQITKQEVKKPAVVAQAPEQVQAKAAPVQTKPVEAANFVVQVGAFSNAATATQEAGKLKAWGFKAYTELISGTTRVRVGPYAERDKADEVRRLLEKHGLHPVVTAVK